MGAGYLAGMYFGRYAKSISYLLFLASLSLAFVIFKITKDVISIKKLESIGTDQSVNIISADMIIYLVTFLFGFAVSYLFCMRIMNLSVNKTLRVLMLIPVLNLSALFLRLPKTLEPDFQITKWNAPAFLAIALAGIVLPPELEKAKAEVELRYFDRLRASKAIQVVEVIKKNRGGLPYTFDADGFLNVFDLEANNNLVEYKIKETQPDTFDWESEDMNAWLLSELCNQQMAMNTSGPLKVFVKFKIFDFAGQLRKDKRTFLDTCN